MSDSRRTRVPYSERDRPCGSCGELAPPDAEKKRTKPDTPGGRAGGRARFLTAHLLALTGAGVYHDQHTRLTAC
jgi:hypothetical protein